MRQKTKGEETGREEEKRVRQRRSLEQETH